MKLYLFLLLVLSGCNRTYLACRSEYLTPKFLASERINTPDPARDCYYGEQVIVRYKGCYDDEVCLRLTIRYGNKTTEIIEEKLSIPKGYFIYQLINADYWEREGIVCYKVELFQRGELLESWRHHVWVDII